jgi:hypothetical protein
MTANPIGDVMDALGVSLATIPGLRVFDFPPDSAQPPFAFVDLPETITYDLTSSRATDRFTVMVHVGVGTRRDRVTRDKLAAYAAGSSIKAAIEGTVLAGASFRVMSAQFGSIELAGGSYPGVVFTVDVAA